MRRSLAIPESGRQGHRLTLTMFVFSALSFGTLAGCDFFNELEGNESETDSGSADDEGEASGETGDGCGLAQDMCTDQDELLSCNFETGELSEYNCASVCAPNINVTCMMTPSLAHACWCAAPGDIKIDSCTQLESCLNNCGPNATGECGYGCMSRTDAGTIRLFGALLSCADIACDSVCKQDVNVCADCILSARAGLSGNCSLERSICDQDSSEPWN